MFYSHHATFSVLQSPCYNTMQQLPCHATTDSMQLQHLGGSRYRVRSSQPLMFLGLPFLVTMATCDSHTTDLLGARSCHSLSMRPVSQILCTSRGSASATAPHSSVREGGSDLLWGGGGGGGVWSAREGIVHLWGGGGGSALEREGRGVSFGPEAGRHSLLGVMGARGGVVCFARG